MSKDETDYSNTIIYKITCNDPLVTDVYVGHTINFVRRKYQHKLACNNNLSCYNNVKLYKIIRNNGNWSNWDMSIVAFYKCKDQTEARQKEQEHFISLGATLNSVEPFPQKVCSDVNPIIKKMVKRIEPIPEKIVNSIEPIPEKIVNSIKITQVSISSKKYCCETCTYYTNNKKDWTKHIVTLKHIKLITPNAPIPKVILSEFKCNCKKVYKHVSSLYFHKKTCNVPLPLTNNELLHILIQQNIELTKKFLN